MLKRLLLSLFFLGIFPLVQAHDPGLSRATVELSNTSLAINMVFAWQDIEALTPIDLDHDGKVTMTEFSAAQPALLSIFASGVVVRSESDVSSSKMARMELTSNDAIQVTLTYSYSQASLLDIQISILDQLARGHRQYLMVQNANGALRSQYILKANSPPFLVQAPGADTFEVFRSFVSEGVWHIWIGFDHILFLLTLLLPAVLIYRESGWEGQQKLRPAVRDMLKVVTAFTLAHSITLVLAVLGFVTPPSRLVESVIAFSILVTAVNNLRPIFPASRWLLAFGFGLIHGFGFAGVLLELELPADALMVSLLGFNLGVEAGQLAIVLLVFPVIAVLRHTRLYRTWIFNGGSTIAAVVATIWMVERIFGCELPLF